MHRFYLPPERCAGDSLRLEGREAHHALHVLRLKCDDAVSILDGTGNDIFCAVASTAKDSLTLVVTERKFTSPLPCSITLLVGVPKGKIIESIIQKSVELGARKIVPLLTERVVICLDEKGRLQKQEQWQQVAIEAIKQCGAAWLPKIEAPMTIEQFLTQKKQFDLSLVGSLQKERRHPNEVLHEFETKHGRLPKNVAVWIGPEGDFTLGEVQVIQTSGAEAISLGRLVLRVETAAIYCLSILNYEMNNKIDTSWLLL